MSELQPPSGYKYQASTLQPTALPNALLCGGTMNTSRSSNRGSRVQTAMYNGDTRLPTPLSRNYEGNTRNAGSYWPLFSCGLGKERNAHTPTNQDTDYRKLSFLRGAVIGRASV